MTALRQRMIDDMQIRSLWQILKLRTFNKSRFLRDTLLNRRTCWGQSISGHTSSI